MMRLLLGLLLVANLLLFLYGYLGLDQRTEEPSRKVHEPDVGSIRLLAARVVEAAPPGEMEEPSEPEEKAVPEEEKPAAAAEKKPLPETVAPVMAEEEPASPEEETAASPVTPVKEVVAEPPAETGQEEAVALQEEPPEETEPESVVTEPPSLYCGAVGPLRSRVQAKRLRRKLGSAGGVRIVQKPTLVDKAHWVLIPPLPSRGEARTMVRKLKAEGINDLWLIPGGELKNAISLGLYSRREAAYNHAESLRSKGFDVEVRPKQEELPRYWLEFSGLSADLLEQLAAGELPKGAGVKKNVCGQASAAP